MIILSDVKIYPIGVFIGLLDIFYDSLRFLQFKLISNKKTQT